MASRINVCDIPDKFDKLKAQMHGKRSYVTRISTLMLSANSSIPRGLRCQGSQRRPSCLSGIRLYNIFCGSRVHTTCCSRIWPMSVVMC